MAFRRKRRNFKKRTFKRKTRGRGRRRARRNRVSSIVLRRPSMIADRAFVKLKWNATYTNVLSGGLPYQSMFRFRASGAQDPDPATGGSSPRAWTRWAAFYRRYCCFGSSIAIRVNSFNATAITQFADLCIYPSTQDQPLTDYETARAGPYAKQTNKNTVFGQLRLKNYCNVAKMYAVNKKQIAGGVSYSAYTISTTANVPPREVFWNVLLRGQSASASFHVDVAITYYLMFFEREDSVPMTDAEDGHKVEIESTITAP